MGEFSMGIAESFCYWVGIPVVGILGGMIGLYYGYHIARANYYLLKEELDLLLERYRGEIEKMRKDNNE